MGSLRVFPIAPPFNSIAWTGEGTTFLFQVEGGVEGGVFCLGGGPLLSRQVCMTPSRISCNADQIMANLQHFCNNNIIILNYYYFIRGLFPSHSWWVESCSVRLSRGMVCSRQPRNFQGVDSHGQPDRWIKGRRDAFKGSFIKTVHPASGEASLFLYYMLGLLHVHISNKHTWQTSRWLLINWSSS
jgi:hypothetical protein